MDYFFPNFAFEDELCRPDSQLSAGTQRAVAELAPLLGLAAEAADSTVVVADGALPGDLPACLKHVRFAEESAVGRLKDGDRLVPWGWTKKSAEFAEHRGISQDSFPNIDAVRKANSRSFNSQFDIVIGQTSAQAFGKAFGCLCHSMNDVLQTIRQLRAAGFDRWVAKPQISHAGRNRLLVTGETLNSQQDGWLQKRLEDGVYMEPWAELLTEYSVQFDVPRLDATNCAPLFLGMTQLLNDHVGRYAGNLLLSQIGNSELDCMVRHGQLVCEAAQAAGYFGPIGIDGFRFIDQQGNVGFRVCNDINARYTMGRLALHFRTLLAEGENGAWCQFSVQKATDNYHEVQDLEETARKILVDSGSKGVQIVGSSPRSIGGGPVRTSTLLIKGLSAADILKAQQILSGNAKMGH